MERGDAVNDRVYSPRLDAKAIWSNRSESRRSSSFPVMRIGKLRARPIGLAETAEASPLSERGFAADTQFRHFATLPSRRGIRPVGLRGETG